MNPIDFNILDLIPQRPPMVMIDRLVYADERSATGCLLVKQSNLFCEKGLLRESGLIEFIAQTAAAFTGYKSRINSSLVREGYIGAVKNLIVSSLPPVNSEIQCEIVVENEIVGFTIITGKVYYAEQVIAQCEMRILAQVPG